MKFSAWLGSATPWPDLLDLAQHVARTGWHGVWIADHFMPNREENLGPTQEAWTLLAGLAALVPNVRLGSLVTGNTYRHPAVLAKEVAQVDIISGGRAVLGLGAGWQENEHVAYSIPYYTVGGRLRRLEESVQIIRSLFDNERTDLEGRYYQIRRAPLAPKPVQSHLPILIGGGGEKVTMRIAASYADEWNIWGSPETLQRKGQILERHCEDAGRDPADMKRSAQALVTISNDPAVLERARSGGGFQSIAGSLEEIRDQIGRYADAKVDEFILPDFNLGRTIPERKDSYDRFMSDVASNFA
ncbi:MAG TPA: TIGR03560 family F420-dependent LLM class oxidoreductase [Dehalococcoidia bacterium]|nr:TIGR03560 family F420-dependent LLM class oxidoreductase [Dehalococcoidia bacterium]